MYYFMSNFDKTFRYTMESDTNSSNADKRLISQIRGNDKRAFDTLFIKYYAVLCAYACRFVAIEDAEETVQDTMLYIWENRAGLLIETSVQSYLFAAIKNRCYTMLNRNALRMQIESLLPPEMKAEFEDPDFYIADELSKRIDSAIDKLPESYRQAFKMHRFQDKTYQEIADELNISTKTVDYRIQQSLKILRRELREYISMLLLM